MGVVIDARARFAERRELAQAAREKANPGPKTKSNNRTENLRRIAEQLKGTEE